VFEVTPKALTGKNLTAWSNAPTLSATVRARRIGRRRTRDDRATRYRDQTAGRYGVPHDYRVEAPLAGFVGHRLRTDVLVKRASWKQGALFRCSVATSYPTHWLARL
jgi:hypothetical protein